MESLSLFVIQMKNLKIKRARAHVYFTRKKKRIEQILWYLRYDVIIVNELFAHLPILEITKTLISVIEKRITISIQIRTNNTIFCQFWHSICKIWVNSQTKQIKPHQFECYHSVESKARSRRSKQKKTINEST